MFDKTIIINEIAKGYSLREICNNHNWTYHRAYYWCKQNNINITRANNGKSKTTLIARQKSRKIPKQNHARLVELYAEQNKSLEHIAKIFDTTKTTVAKTLRYLNVPIKLTNGKHKLTKPKYSKHTLYKLYVVKQLSSHEIAELLDYNNYGAVINDLKFYNIPRRSYKDAGKLLYEKHPEKKEIHREQFYKGITGPKNINISSLEQYFIDWAVALGIKYKHQFQIRQNWHRYDFLIQQTNIIVEMDGDFWHSLPEHKIRDAKFDQTAERHGFTVVRIRESEVKSNPNILTEKLIPMIIEETKQHGET